MSHRAFIPYIDRRQRKQNRRYIPADITFRAICRGDQWRTESSSLGVPYRRRRRDARGNFLPASRKNVRAGKRRRVLTTGSSRIRALVAGIVHDDLGEVRQVKGVENSSAFIGRPSMPRGIATCTCARSCRYYYIHRVQDLSEKA